MKTKPDKRKPAAGLPAMKTRPILFSGPMVRALLDGTKTQTRRIVKPQPTELPNGNFSYYARNGLGFSNHPLSMMVEHSDGLCPYGQTGDRLWVRETFTAAEDPREPTKILYREDPMFDSMKKGDCAWDWTPSIFMRREYSRITLEVVSVRVERLQDISEKDAKAEGVVWQCDPPCEDCRKRTAKQAYSILWDSINGKKHPWDANSWVWVLEFNRINSTENQ